MEEGSGELLCHLQRVNKVKKQFTLTIRPVRDTDYEALSGLFEENNIPEVVRHFNPFPLTRQTAYKIANTSQLDRYYVALWNGRIVGLCMLRGWDDGFEIPSFGIFVDYRYHGLGVGRQMTEFGIAETQRLDCHAVRLSVYASNTRAVNLYISLGFKEISREPVLVTGEPDAKIIMVKDLK